MKQYDLIDSIRECQGVIIGMSAGSNNMGKTAICTVSCGHESQVIYEGLGLVDVSVEPHIQIGQISKEVLELSEKYPIYGMCDDSMLIVEEGSRKIIGDIVYINKGEISNVMN